MFNSFYESMPPVELGKRKSLALIFAFAILFVSLLVAAGSGIYWIISTAVTAVDYFGLITILMILYLSGKGIYSAYQRLFLPYTKKNYKTGYGDLQQMKRSIMFQMIFLGIAIMITAFSSRVAWTLVKIIYVAAMSYMLFVSLAIYMGTNALLNPFKDELRKNMVKQQQEMQEKMKNDPSFGSQWGKGFPGKGPMPPGNQEPTVFSDEEQQPEISDEEIVRSSGGKVIDITEDSSLDSTHESENNKKEEVDSKEEQSKPSEPFSAF